MPATVSALPRPGALGRGGHAHHVHLADRRVVAVPGVHLGPVEAEDPVRGVDGQQEPGGIEPRLGHPGVQVGAGHVALLRMVREGGPVRGEPGVLVPAGHEGARASRRPAAATSGSSAAARGEPHLPQFADGAVAVARGEVGGGLVVAVGPGLEARRSRGSS